jgi:arginase
MPPATRAGRRALREPGMTRKLAVLDAPRHLGKRPKPGAPVDAHWLSYEQRQRDLVARLHARDAGLVEAPGCRCGEEPVAKHAGSRAHGRGDTRIGFQSFTEALAKRTREIVGGREFPVVLGGDCSILLGNMLALRGLGRYGLVFVDGRDEFSYAPGQQRHCGYFAAAGLDLALATGNGPDSLSNLNGLRPYVDERNVVLFGMVREPGEAMLGPDAPDLPIQQFHIERIREVGARAAASEALRYLEAQKVDGFWIHVDGDVLDRVADPDGDEEDTEPGGLEFDELSDALRVFLSSQRAAGMEMTIYDPELDPEGVFGEQLVDSVVRAFDAATM